MVQTCFGVSERVSWLASLSSSSVSPRVLCDTWRYSRIISTICERATMKHSQVSSQWSNQLICHDKLDNVSAGPIRLHPCFSWLEIDLISMCEATVQHTCKSSGKLTFWTETFSDVMAFITLVISILVQ